MAAVQREDGLKISINSKEVMVTPLTDVDFILMRFGKVVALGTWHFE